MIRLSRPPVRNWPGRSSPSTVGPVNAVRTPRLKWNFCVKLLSLGGSRYTIMSAEPIDDLHKVLNKTLGIESPISWQKHLEATIPIYNAWHRDNNERVKSLASKKGITLIG